MEHGYLRNAQGVVYSARRSSFERCTFKTDGGTTGASCRGHCGVNANLQEGSEGDIICSVVERVAEETEFLGSDPEGGKQHPNKSKTSHS